VRTSKNFSKGAKTGAEFVGDEPDLAPAESRYCKKKRDAAAVLGTETAV